MMIVLWVATTLYLMIGAIVGYLGYVFGHTMSGNPRSVWYCLWYVVAWGPIGLYERYIRRHLKKKYTPGSKDAT